MSNTADILKTLNTGSSDFELPVRDANIGDTVKVSEPRLKLQNKIFEIFKNGAPDDIGGVIQYRTLLIEECVLPITNRGLEYRNKVAILHKLYSLLKNNNTVDHVVSKLRALELTEDVLEFTAPEIGLTAKFKLTWPTLQHELKYLKYIEQHNPSLTGLVFAEIFKFVHSIALNSDDFANLRNSNVDEVHKIYENLPIQISEQLITYISENISEGLKDAQTFDGELVYIENDPTAFVTDSQIT